MGRLQTGLGADQEELGAAARQHRQLFRFPIYARARGARRRRGRDRGPGHLPDRGRPARGRRRCSSRSGIYGASFVGIYFGVGLAATADGSSAASDATFADGIAVARDADRRDRRLGGALGPRRDADRARRSSRAASIGEAIIGTLGGAAWSLITFLAVPVIAFEGPGPLATLKRSASLFKERWAGQVTGNVAIGGIVFLVGVLPAIAADRRSGCYLWVVRRRRRRARRRAAIVARSAIVLLVVAMLIVQAMRGVFGVALYRFAATGEVDAGLHRGRPASPRSGSKS